MNSLAERRSPLSVMTTQDEQKYPHYFDQNKPSHSVNCIPRHPYVPGALPPTFNFNPYDLGQLQFLRFNWINTLDMYFPDTPAHCSSYSFMPSCPASYDAYRLNAVSKTVFSPPPPTVPATKRLRDDANDQTTSARPAKKVALSDPVTPDRKPIPFSPPKKITPCRLLSEGSSNDISGYWLSDIASPNTKALMRREVGSPLIVKYGPDGLPSEAYKQVGDELVRLDCSRQSGDLTTFVVGKHVQPPDVYDPSLVCDIESPYEPFTRFSASIVLTKERVAQFAGKRKTWPTRQDDVMGMSATEAAKCAGLDVQGSYHWMHLFAFSEGGENGVEPNEPQNFVIGSPAANGQHLVLEEIAKSYATEHGAVVVSYHIDPKQKISDAKWHLFESFTYEIYDVEPTRLADYRAGKLTAEQAKGKCIRSERINTLNRTKAHPNDQKYVAAKTHVDKLRARGFTSNDESPTLGLLTELTPTRLPTRRKVTYDDDEYQPWV